MSVTVLAKRPVFLEGLPAYATLPGDSTATLSHNLLHLFIQIYSGTPCRAWMHSS
jgi:hypothetical protein